MRSSEFDKVILYRGDASKVEKFSTEHTRNSIGLLFGMGIYLTDNSLVALDYTTKGGWRRDRTGTVLVQEAPNKATAIRDYLSFIIHKQLGWDEHVERFRQGLMQQIFDRVPDYNGEVWDRTVSPPQKTPEYEAFSKARDEAWEEMRASWNDKLQVELGKFLQRAKKIYKQQSPDLRVYRDTAGKWSIMTNAHEGHMTTFEVPRDYVERTIHGDRPMTPEVLAIVSKVVAEVFGDRLGDFRTRDGTFMQFDNWIEHFKTKGSNYAWRGKDDGVDPRIGGKGVNPTLDEVMNGQHGGFDVFYKHMDLFIKLCQEAGYTGIEYDGGVRIGNLNRGGGGIRHHSFSFWDDDFINSCIVQQHGIHYDVADTEDLRSIRKSSVPLTYRDD